MYDLSDSITQTSPFAPPGDKSAVLNFFVIVAIIISKSYA